MSKRQSWVAHCPQERERLLGILETAGGALTVRFGQLTYETEIHFEALQTEGLVEVTICPEDMTRTYRLTSESQSAGDF